jgi:choline dehydrogenase
MPHALKAQYDFIVCGLGSSGSVVGRRLAENTDVSCCFLRLVEMMTAQP